MINLSKRIKAVREDTATEKYTVHRSYIKSRENVRQWKWNAVCGGNAHKE